MRLIEITWNSDRAAELIAQLRLELPECIIGTGTLLNLNHMEQAIAQKCKNFNAKMQSGQESFI